MASTPLEDFHNPTLNKIPSTVQLVGNPSSHAGQATNAIYTWRHKGMIHSLVFALQVWTSV